MDRQTALNPTSKISVYHVVKVCLCKWLVYVIPFSGQRAETYVFVFFHGEDGVLRGGKSN
jgi:hypothetical protein